MKITETSALIPSPSRVETENVADAIPEPRAKRRNIKPVEPEEEFEEIELEEVDSIPCNGAIPKVFILGQEKATLALQGSLNSFHATGEFENAVLITGPAGVGKSHSYRAFRDAIQKTGKNVNTVEIDSASEISNIPGPGDGVDKATLFINALKYSARGIYSIILIDEAHKINDLGAAMHRVIDSVIFGSGQGWKRSGSVTIGKKTIHYNTRFLLFVLATNFPEKVIRGNKDAFTRRFLHVELEKYSPAIMRKITLSYFKEKGIELDSAATTELVKIHRGTLTALDDFMMKSKGHHTGLITKEIFDKILPICQHSLRGFLVEEIKALRWLSVTEEPKTRGNLTQNFPRLDVPAFYRHAVEQETKEKGKETSAHTPFIKMIGNQYEVTENGKAWLKKNDSL